MSKGLKLKEAFASQACVALPGCYDGFSAHVIEKLGFPGAFVGGFGLCGSTLGMPDMGLMTENEVVNRVRSLANCVEMPIICDIDTGYGGVLNVTKVIQDMEAAGVAGIQIEDQDIDAKHCSEMNLPIALVSAEEMQRKIRAAAAARKDKDFMLITRCDAKEFGMDEVKRRFHCYLDAGADMLVLTQKYTFEEYADFAQEFPGKILSTGGQCEYDVWNRSLADWASIGIKGIVYPSVTYSSAIRAMEDVLRPLYEKGQMTTEFLQEKIYDVPAISDLVGLEQYNALKRRLEA